MQREDPNSSANCHEAADRLAYFDAVAAGYSRAEQAAGAVERFYNVGGYILLLRFAGPAMLDRLGRALAHLETSRTDAPALTVCLWDSASTRTKMPLLVRSLIHLLRLRWWEQLAGRREIKEYSDERIRTTFHLGPDILSLLDIESNRAYYWVEDAAQLPYYERGYPLQAILSCWAERRGNYYVHAAAVGTADGGVLLAGQSGSGKSTTTASCLLAGLPSAADDYTLVSLSPDLIGHSLYNTVKLRTAEDLARSPQLAASVSNGDRLDEEKPLIFLHEHYPRQVLLSFPIRAILLPRIGGGTACSVRPATARAGLQALAPSTLLQLPGTGQGTFHAIASLVRRVPCFTLELGSDPAQVPAVISRLLKGLS